MKNNLLRVLLLLFGLFVSPVILAVIACLIFIFVELILGSNVAEAFSGLEVIINKIIPFLPYITIIPAAVFLLTILFTNKDKVKIWAKRY